MCPQGNFQSLDHCSFSFILFSSLGRSLHATKTHTHIYIYTHSYSLLFLGLYHTTTLPRPLFISFLLPSSLLWVVHWVISYIQSIKTHTYTPFIQRNPSAKPLSTHSMARSAAISIHRAPSLQLAYQQLIQSEGMVEHLVRGLREEDPELQKHCASAIFKVGIRVKG